MTVTLPADADTERLARKLAQATGKPLPVIVKQAIEAEAVKAGVTAPARLSRDELLLRMTEITAGFAALPVLDPRSADEIAGYDEFGLVQ
jgi:antitoxin VapB